MNQPLNSINESLNSINEALNSINEALNSINESLNSINESLILNTLRKRTRVRLVEKLVVDIAPLPKPTSKAMIGSQSASVPY